MSMIGTALKEAGQTQEIAESWKVQALAWKRANDVLGEDYKALKAQIEEMRKLIK
jgi:hypothetical protein